MQKENQNNVIKYVRYSAAGKSSFGILEGETIHELRGDIFQGAERTSNRLRQADVQLLAPCEPSKVIAIGLNYKSHLGQRSATTYPGVFIKLPTSIIATGEKIVFPPGAKNVHYEGEMVVVIGRKAHRIAAEDAPHYIFGVTAGNDVSERDWQKGDLQWFRAKGSDTFGPLGPAIVRGLDYNDLHVQSRLNGEVRQSQSTRDLIFGVDTLVSYVSQFVTLLPGDIIFTGTPGETKAMQPGDLIEVEVEGVGVLRNEIGSAE